jgi:hypothetical protein
MKKTLLDLELEPKFVAPSNAPLLAELTFKSSDGQVLAQFKCPILTHVEKHVDWVKMEINLSYPKPQPVEKKSKWAL